MTLTSSKISIVTTMYKSENFIVEFYSKALETVKQITNNYEFVFVDDGSPDNSAATASKLEGPVKVVKFSKNFGHHHAMMAACEYATGDYVFLIDSDLEEPPETLLTFWDEMQKQKEVDVVYGIQNKRKGSFLERISGGVFYRLFNYLADISVPLNLLTVRLMTRRYVDALLLHKEKEIFIAGLWEITGFNQVAKVVKKFDKGQTSYTFSQKFYLLINSITAFSKKPLHLIFQLSVFFLALTFGFSLFTVYQKIIFPAMPIGYASLLISIWFFGGLILFCIGILGIYVSKLFSEVKNRPLFIVKEITDKTES